MEEVFLGVTGTFQVSYLFTSKEDVTHPGFGVQLGSLGTVRSGGSRPRGLLHGLLHVVVLEVFVGWELGEAVVFLRRPCRVVHCLDRIKYVGMGGYFSIRTLVENGTRKSNPSIPKAVGGLVVWVKVLRSRIRVKWNGEEVLIVGAS